MPPVWAPETTVCDMPRPQICSPLGLGEAKGPILAHPRGLRPGSSSWSKCHPVPRFRGSSEKQGTALSWEHPYFMTSLNIEK